MAAMGEAKRKAASANDGKIIEASEVERFCMVHCFGRAGTAGCVALPDGRMEQRRYERLFADFDLDAVEELSISISKADPGAFNFAKDLSSELMEFSTTLDVIEYVIKATDTKITGIWVRPILRVVERMLGCKEGTYKAPSVLAAFREEAPALAAVGEHHE